MDGIDLDWEYPGAQDIPGIPSADPFDGQSYVELLKLLRQKLGKEKTISIAAPASYWYLQNFPIAEMAQVVDYIIYMTYDLHGQWDHNSKWAMPGFDGTSCLRSHINMTETMSSLAMITKASVPSNKIVVGVSSYGRSFETTQAECTGPQCSFTGPDSTAKKGRCTGTSGHISNAEIDDIIKSASAGGKRAEGAIQTFTDDTE
ncbi:glycoside hydrolase superfamily [Podospora appendiculata]|uniref:chitinase n=1 Tax=Podospora appendiculata TaxID=314037 RepID=A0AAE1CCN8_9PEZI|nr:glycoside hydrolase superfamily [Podospora appendiculata]